MREKLRDITRLEHIQKCINNIFNFTKDINVDIETLTENKEKYYALVYNIMVIGEAANMLTKEFRNEHPNTQWRSIVDMRNFIAHGYYNVSVRVVCEVILNDLPILKEQIERYITELKENEGIRE